MNTVQRNYREGLMLGGREGFMEADTGAGVWREIGGLAVKVERGFSAWAGSEVGAGGKQPTEYC